MSTEPVQHKRLTAAKRRRDDGASAPFLWDNAILALSGEPGNSRAPMIPDAAALTGVDKRVIERLSNNPLSARELGDAVGMSEPEVRACIDRLRDPLGWWIENDRRGRFMLVPLPPVKVAA